MLEEDGYITLTDFGLAKLLEGKMVTHTFCGTSDYIAPEVLDDQGKGHTFSVDWWTLGILIYEMIVGIPPFYTGSNNIQKKYDHIKKKEVQFPD